MEKRTADHRHEKIDMLLGYALKKQVFSACSIGYFRITKNGREGDILHYGRSGEGRHTFPVDDQTVFDLASLTKPLVVSLSMLALIEEKKVILDERIDKFFKIHVPGHAKITLFHLLNHCSGLPAHRPFYKKMMSVSCIKKRKHLTDWILDEELLYDPGTANIYSDLGFMLLGMIIEKISGDSLDEYWRKKIVLPLGLDKDLFFASTQKKRTRVYAATGVCDWSKKRLYGEVHDDNCRALGGVAGHAGLFGTAKAVVALCENIVLQYQGRQHHPSYSSQILRKALDDKKGNWIFGFDTPSDILSSSGRYFSNQSIGHLGFTGTSFWIDLQRAIGIVFLTNRVLSGDDLAAIKKLRPLLHDIIMEDLIKKSG